MSKAWHGPYADVTFGGLKSDFNRLKAVVALWCCPPVACFAFSVFGRGRRLKVNDQKVPFSHTATVWARVLPLGSVPKNVL